MYSILLNEDFSLQRDEFLKQLKELGIDNRPFFYPIHQMPPYQGSGTDFPIADNLSRRGLNLPSAVTLTDSDIARITQTIRKLS